MKPKEFFRNISIQHKLLLITLTICAAVVCIAVTALFSFQIVNFRRNFEADTSTLATIIANNSAAAVAFGDRKAATETINSLKAKSTVRYACLVNNQGEIIAQFGEREEEQPLPQFPPAREFAYANGTLLYTEAIYLDDKRIGSLFLQSNYQTVRGQLMRFYLFLVVLIFAVSAFMALWLSEKLGQLITRPLSALTETARLVGEKNDYSARSPMDGRKDELGLLGATFNQMLQQIQQQDQALNLSQQKLGSLVNSIDGIVWEWDAKTAEFTFMSEQCRRILGYPPEAWLGRADFWDKIVHPDDLEKATS